MILSICFFVKLKINGGESALGWDVKDVLTFAFFWIIF